jgi:hypothetical protein
MRGFRTAWKQLPQTSFDQIWMAASRKSMWLTSVDVATTGRWQQMQ